MLKYTHILNAQTGKMYRIIGLQTFNVSNPKPETKYYSVDLQPVVEDYEDDCRTAIVAATSTEHGTEYESDMGKTSDGRNHVLSKLFPCGVILIWGAEATS